MRSRLWMLVAAGLIAAVLVSCSSSDDEGLEASSERRIQMAAIEPKGSTTVDKEPFPNGTLPAGGGYALKAPGAEGSWTVETYQWSPGTLTVVEGDHVVLDIVGINGASHPATIEGYGIDFEVKRGELTTVEFDADRPGLFTIACHAHQPAMNATLVVLPSS